MLNYLLLTVVYIVAGGLTLRYFWQLDDEAGENGETDERVMMGILMTCIFGWPLFIAGYAVSHLLGFGRVKDE